MASEIYSLARCVSFSLLFHRAKWTRCDLPPLSLAISFTERYIHPSPMVVVPPKIDSSSCREPPIREDALKKVIVYTSPQMKMETK